MSTKQTNLIPRERVQTAERDYYLRLLATATFALTILVIIQGVLLVPAYQYAQEEKMAHEAHIRELERTQGTQEEQSSAQRLEQRAASATQASELMAIPSVTGAVRSVLAVPRPGIFVTRFALTQEGQEGKLVISGTASTREALRTYHLALQALSFVTSADLPLSAYTAESAIPFSITLTTTP